MDASKELVHLARLVVQNKHVDATVLAKRAMRGIIRERPDLSKDAEAILDSLDKAGMLRGQLNSQPLPVDLDSRLELLKRDSQPLPHHSLTWPLPVAEELHATLSERQKMGELLDAGLLPTRSLLFVGAPGVGKTLAARWLSTQLERPLLTLDLAAVMSSFLGRTGGNIRVVLDYARKFPCVLLLDEFDAIAKRRDDDSEVGELKRLVTVLLQEIDTWPDDGLLIAATNHPELLDPAIWRRFDRVVDFPLPSFSEIQHTVRHLLQSDEDESLQVLVEPLAIVLAGDSFAEVTRKVNIIRRHAVVNELSLSKVLEEYVRRNLHDMSTRQKAELAISLIENGYSQRNASSMMGISRDTIRRHMSKPRKVDQYGPTKEKTK